MAQKRIPEKVKRSLQAFIKEIEEDHIPVQRVYVFGSYAKGTQHQWSDLDVCVISSKFTHPWKALEYLWKKRPKNIDPMIEPVGFSLKDFSGDDSTLVAEIKNNGIRFR